MKRKIAILLSAVMVAGCMPVIASAGTSFDVKSYQGVAVAVDSEIGTYKLPEVATTNDLSNRDGLVVLDVTSQDFGGAIKAGDTITLKVENGSVGNDISAYEYKNIDATKVLTVNDPSNIITQDSLKTITGNVTNYLKSLMKNPNLTGDITSLFTDLTTTTGATSVTAVENSSPNETVLTFTGTIDETKVKAEMEKFLKANNGITKVSPDVPYEVISAQDSTIKIKVLADVDTDVFKNTVKTYTLGTVLKDASGSTNTIVTLKRVSTNVEEDTRLVVPVGIVKADGEGDVKVAVTGFNNNNKLEEKIVTVGKAVSSSSSSVRSTIDEVKSFEDSVKLATINIQEIASGMLDVKDNAGAGNDTLTIEFRLSNGYKFANRLNLMNNVNVTTDNDGFEVAKSGSEFTVTGDDKAILVLKGTKKSGPINLQIAPKKLTKGLVIETIDDKSSNYGDVSLRIDSSNYRGDLVVAKRETLGFNLDATTDVPEIVSGRTADTIGMIKDSSNLVTAKELDEKDFQSVKFKFSETTPNTLVTARNLDFLIPEGVKIVDFSLKSSKGFNGLDANSFTIQNDGDFLRLGKNTITKATDGISGSFELVLDLSIDAGFTGDVTLNVEGGGQTLEQTKGIIIAKAVEPVAIKANSTNLNLGYQNYKTSDITIVENKVGALIDGGNINLKIAAPYGESEIGFSKADIEVSGTELKVKNFKVNKDIISFDIDRASYKEPATVTIKGVQIGTSRSVPYGSYDLDLYGSSLINNYADQDNNDTISTAEDKVLAANPTGKYIIKDYAKIVTATGTLDQEVRVSVGEKTVVVGGKAIDMDTAPYIQAASDSTMVPLRFVSLALGVDSANVEDADNSDKIQYDASSKVATIFYGAGSGQKLIQFQAGSNKMIVDGTEVPMANGVKTEIKEGRMFVPFRALGQALGIQVNWDADTRTAIYNQNISGSVTESTTETTTATTESKTTTKESTTETTTETTTQ